jgi:FKBP-type peptidyl-prolyl cis-trans isomerase SlyD
MSDETVGRDCVVSVHYVLRDPDGEQIDASPEDNPLSYLHGHGQVVPGIERVLEGTSEGETVRAVIPPSEAYGDRDPERMIQVERAQFDFEPVEGAVVRAELPDGRTHPFTIASVAGDAVILDGNHPLAGMPLDFEITVVEVRAATEAELAEAATEADEHQH